MITDIWPTIKQWAFDFTRILFPVTCPVCNTPLVEGERLLCLECLAKLPRTNYHLSNDNPIHYKLVDINVPIEKAASYFFYKNDSPYSRLLRDAKYNNRPEIIHSLSVLFAGELSQAGFFDGIDAIMPLPIHWAKRLKRGYNQSDYIARGLGEVSGISAVFNLRAAKGHKTQTRKKARERRKALPEIFVVDKPEELIGKHILLVDDIITTGATIASCISVLHNEVPGIRLSVLTIATTKLGR